MVKSIRRRLKYFLWWLKIYNQSKETRKYVDVFEPIWISPSLIQKAVIPYHIKPYSYTSDKISSDLDLMGKIIGGEWDLETMKFSELDIFQSFSLHFLSNVSWEDTSLFERAARTIKNGEKFARCTSLDQLKKRFSEYDKLYLLIEEKGYKSQKQLNNFGQFGIKDEIAVHVDRNGDFVFINGRHRLSIAKLLNIQKIPVQIVIRHEQWFLKKFFKQ